MPSRSDTSSLSRVADERLRRWIEELLATPGLTAIRDAEEAWRVHVEQSLVAVPQVERYGGPLVDEGSGGGAPGLPLAAAFSVVPIILIAVYLALARRMGAFDAL